MQTSYRFLLAVHFPWIYSQKLVNNMGILSRRLKFMTAYFLRKRQLLLPFDNFFSWVLITSNSNLLSVTLASCCLQCGWQKTKWDYEAYCDNFCRSSFWILDRCILSHIVINKGADFFFFFQVFFGICYAPFHTHYGETRLMCLHFDSWISRPAFFHRLIYHTERLGNQASQIFILMWGKIVAQLNLRGQMLHQRYTSSTQH